MSNTRRSCFSAVGIAILIATLLFYQQYLRWQTDVIDTKKSFSSLANRLLLEWPNGLSEDTGFGAALIGLPEVYRMGRVDLQRTNPLPNHLPQKQYHFEKNSPSKNQKRVVLWTEVRSFWMVRYVVMDSKWNVVVINKSDQLPSY
jgi:hypothetical protein